MHTTSTSPATVYLHPAATTTPATVQRIEHATGRVAVFSLNDRAPRLIVSSAQRDTATAQPKGGVA